uniref:Uncharacterized protein n=1 Tax=Fagus sylvatica TaxID=28930 RepID=A0A2N9GWV0_FAGSY
MTELRQFQYWHIPAAVIIKIAASNPWCCGLKTEEEHIWELLAVAMQPTGVFHDNQSGVFCDNPFVPSSVFRDNPSGVFRDNPSGVFRNNPSGVFCDYPSILSSVFHEIHLLSSMTIFYELF